MKGGRWLLIAHAAATWMMVGVIWFVQMVHYPLMGAVGVALFSQYAIGNVAATTWAVGPIMLVEAAAAVGLFFRRPQGVKGWQPGAGLGLLAAIFACTAFIELPLNARLCEGFDPDALSMLVATNWIRTGLWTLRGALAAWMLFLWPDSTC